MTSMMLLTFSPTQPNLSPWDDFSLYGEEFFCYDSKWKGGRVVDGTGLENRQVNASQVRILSLPPNRGTVAQLVRA